MQGVDRKAYKYRFYATEDQSREVARTFGCVQYVYNWGSHRALGKVGWP